METRYWVAIIIATLIGGFLSFGGTILLIQNNKQMQDLLRGPQGVQGIQGIQGPKGDPYSFNPNYVNILTLNEDPGLNYDRTWNFTSTSSFNRIYWFTDTNWCIIQIYEGYHTLTEINSGSTKLLYQWIGDGDGGTDYFIGSRAYTLRIRASPLASQVYVTIGMHLE